MAFVEANMRKFFSKVRAQLKPSLTLEKFKDTTFLIFYKKTLWSLLWMRFNCPSRKCSLLQLLYTYKDTVNFLPLANSSEIPGTD